MRYRLGLDIGANSIGWCALELDDGGNPSHVLDTGVRIYPDGRNPKDGSSLAAGRRLPRAMRRNRDRYLRRRRKLLSALTGSGLMPADEAGRRSIAAMDPYTLRAKALTEKLDPHQLGRVIFHLNQRRGFKSNRKTDRGSNSETGVIRLAARELQAEMTGKGHATLGAFLAQRHDKREPVRIRLAGSGKTAAYPFYPLREMVEAEFDAICDAQARFGFVLASDLRDRLRRIVFHQRPLRDPPVGRCWLEPTEPRGFRAFPTAQAFRIAQELANLRISEPGMPERALSDSERQTLRAILLRGRSLSFDQVRKQLRLPAEADFNLATLRKQELVGAETSGRLGGKKALGEAWHRLDLVRQDLAVEAMLQADSDEEAIASLVAMGFTPEAADTAVRIALPEGTTALSVKAMGRILPHLEAGQRYSDAVQAAGYAHHSDQRTGEIRDRLPYYGELLFERIGTGSGKPQDDDERRWGRAPNPTVHVALNELRRVVNAIIDLHGQPTEIVVETLRDLGRSAEQKRQQEKEQKANQEANARRATMLNEIGLPVNGSNLMRVRLWEEQAKDPKDRICPYSGTVITLRMALSDEIEEDHILPFSRSLDDSASNRVLVTRAANRRKSQRSPFEAFGSDPDWPSIQDNARHLPQSKRWRFEPDAMAKLAKDGDFLARHLTDSATIARLARMYLEVLAPGKVWSTPGRLTALLRAKLGLNSDRLLGKGGQRKDRTDHRHHAIDAVVVALTDRRLLQLVSTAAGRSEDGRNRLIGALGEPWKGFVDEVGRAIGRIVVSYKPDIGWQGALHNDTAYGAIEPITKKAPNVVVRRPLAALADWKREDIIEGVRDPILGTKIADAVDGKDKSAARQALLTLKHSGGHHVRRVRTVERLESIKAIADRRTGKPYKLVKLDGNHRAELWLLPRGERKLVIVPTFEAAREAEAKRLGRDVTAGTRPHPAARLIFRLHKNDMIALGSADDRKIYRVVKISSGEVTLAEHFEAGNLKARASVKNDSFSYLRASASALTQNKARKVYVDAAGRLRDPGPRAMP
jgi:CRISPR-associated endonuclease Csn1